MCFHEPSWQILLDSVHLFALCLAQGRVVYSFFLCIHSLQMKYFHRLLESNIELSAVQTSGYASKIFGPSLKKNMLSNSLWFTLKFNSCGTGTELLESAQNCFFRISLGFSLHFPTLCICPGLYVWCVFYLFFFKCRAVCLTLKASYCAGQEVQRSGGVFCVCVWGVVFFFPGLFFFFFF